MDAFLQEVNLSATAINVVKDDHYGEKCSQCDLARAAEALAANGQWICCGCGHVNESDPFALNYDGWEGPGRGRLNDQISAHSHHERYVMWAKRKIRSFVEGLLTRHRLKLPPERIISMLLQTFATRHYVTSARRLHYLTIICCFIVSNERDGDVHVDEYVRLAGVRPQLFRKLLAQTLKCLNIQGLKPCDPRNVVKSLIQRYLAWIISGCPERDGVGLGATTRGSRAKRKSRFTEGGTSFKRLRNASSNAVDSSGMKKRQQARDETNVDSTGTDDGNSCASDIFQLFESSTSTFDYTIEDYDALMLFSETQLEETKIEDFSFKMEEATGEGGGASELETDFSELSALMKYDDELGSETNVGPDILTMSSVDTIPDDSVPNGLAFGDGLVDGEREEDNGFDFDRLFDPVNEEDGTPLSFERLFDSECAPSEESNKLDLSFDEGADKCPTNVTPWRLEAQKWKKNPRLHTKWEDVAVGLLDFARDIVEGPVINGRVMEVKSGARLGSIVHIAAKLVGFKSKCSEMAAYLETSRTVFCKVWMQVLHGLLERAVSLGLAHTQILSAPVADRRSVKGPLAVALRALLRTEKGITWV